MSAKYDHVLFMLLWIAEELKLHSNTIKHLPVSQLTLIIFDLASKSLHKQSLGIKNESIKHVDMWRLHVE